MIYIKHAKRGFYELLAVSPKLLQVKDYCVAAITGGIVIKSASFLSSTSILLCVSPTQLTSDEQRTIQHALAKASD